MSYKANFQFKTSYIKNYKHEKMNNLVFKTTLLLLFFSPFLAWSQTEIKAEDQADTPIDPVTAIALPNFWNGVKRNMTTTPYGNVAAINCHNCYYAVKAKPDDKVALEKTLNKIKEAQAKGADLIELDIIEVDDVIRVANKDSQISYGAVLKDILQDEDLRKSDQVLFLEIKETKLTSDRFMWLLLNDLKNYGFAQKGRPVVLRAFEDDARIDHLKEVQDLLNGYFNRMKPHVRLSALINPTLAENTSDFQNRIKKVAEMGFEMIEFNYNTQNLMAHIAYAREMGLAVGLWKIPENLGNILLSSLRDEVDAFSVTYDVKKACNVVKQNNALFYLNAYRKEFVNNDELSFYQNKDELQSLSLSHGNAPALKRNGIMNGDMGNALVFQKGQINFVQSQDIENLPKKGYFVAAAVKFDNLDLEDGQRSVIIGKSNDKDFTLELFNREGNMPTVLRFGVRVNREYHYSFYPAEHLDTKQTYLIIGAYDSDGSVELWVNQDMTGLKMAHTRGAVITEKSPVVVGNGVDEKNAGFMGKIQMALVQFWGKH